MMVQTFNEKLTTMKNLTLSSITILRSDDSRVHLPPAEVVPKLVLIEEAKVVHQGALEFVVPAKYQVNFDGVDMSDDRTPFVVSREIFDALPKSCINFVTPDLETAVLNGLNVPHLIRRFIAKPGFTAGSRNNNNINN